MGWPARSLNQNPIENLLAVLGLAVYYSGWQFDEIEEMKETLVHEWDKINLLTLQNLVKSMPRRIVSQVEARGGFTPC